MKINDWMDILYGCPHCSSLGVLYLSWCLKRDAAVKESSIRWHTEYLVTFCSFDYRPCPALHNPDFALFRLHIDVLFLRHSGIQVLRHTLPTVGGVL